MDGRLRSPRISASTAAPLYSTNGRISSPACGETQQRDGWVMRIYVLSSFYLKKVKNKN
jgi:hypothetical protein